jgi:hypothetical protein
MQLLSIHRFLRFSLFLSASTAVSVGSGYLAGCEEAAPKSGNTEDTADAGEDTGTARDVVAPPADVDGAADDTRGVGEDVDVVTAPDAALEDGASVPDVQVPTDTMVAVETSDDIAVTPEDTAIATDVTGDTNDGPELPTVRPPVTETRTTTLSAFTLQPGRETTRCVLKRLDNPDVLWVSQVRTELAPGSHHLIVYKSDETEERTTPFECDPFVETLRGRTFPIMITQIRNETLSFPNGVAFRFEPNQMVRLEAHYLNYFPNPIDATATVHFDGIAAADVVSEANMLFYGNPDFSVPPNSTFTTPWRFLSVLPGTRVFAMTGHTHTYGTNVEIEFGRTDTLPGTPVYPGADTPFVWDEPPVTQFQPALSFQEGDGFRYRCSWNNTTGQRLEFGESANQEMCFFWAYYYPSQGYRICISPGTIGGGVAGDEVCCPGHWACGLVDQFL